MNWAVLTLTMLFTTAAPNQAVQRDSVAFGTHWRLSTPRGPVHVWRPRGYDAKTAGILLYVHGYYTTVDQAWDQHHLADQFRESRRNALFIVPEAPTGAPDKVRWDDLLALLDTVKQRTHLTMPSGPLVAMGHSGGFRTIVPWLSVPRLERVILVDGLYNCETEMAAWIRADNKANQNHKLVLASFDTIDRTEQLIAAIPDALVREAIPERNAQLRRRDRRARALYLRSQFGHMELVTEGKALPLLLQIADFRPL